MTRSRNRGRLASWWATDRTQQPPAEDIQQEQELVSESSTSANQAVTLRYGYTMEDIDRMARMAVSRCRTTRGCGSSERYDIAWSAIAETLYAAESEPDEHDLIESGQRSIWNETTTSLRNDGYHQHQTRYGPGSSPSFVAYWTWITGTTTTQEDQIIDRIAIKQIWPNLTTRERQVIVALAVTGRTDLAASGLGMTRSNYSQSLSAGRTRFRRLWHQGEVPSRHWSRDVRIRDGKEINSTLRHRMKYRRYRTRKALIETGAIKPRQKPKPIVTETAAGIIAAYMSGMTINEVVTSTGISSWRVRNELSKANVVMRRRGQRSHKK